MFEICNQSKDQFGALLLLKCFSFLLIEFLHPTSQLFSFLFLFLSLTFFHSVSLSVSVSLCLSLCLYTLSFGCLVPAALFWVLLHPSFSAKVSKGNIVWHKHQVLEMSGMISLNGVQFLLTVLELLSISSSTTEWIRFN